MTRYGSDVVVDLLTELGVELIACTPGASFRGLHDSLVHRGAPAVLTCLHEEIAVAVAHGYAKAAGRPMAVAVHDVVGLQHAAMAIYNAWCDRVPVLLLGGTGPVDAALRRPWIDGIHTANVQATQVRDYTKWDDQPASLVAVSESLVRAMGLACAAPAGPVYVCLDTEVQEDPVPDGFARRAAAEHAAPSPLAADGAALDVLAGRLAGAAFPVAVVDRIGRERGAVDCLVDIAQRLAMPVVEVQRDYNRSTLGFPTGHWLNFTGVDLPRQPDVVLSLEAGEFVGPAAGGADVWVAEVSTAELSPSAWAADLARCGPRALSIPATAGAVLAPLRDRLTGNPGPAVHRADGSTTEQVARRRAELAGIVARQRESWRSHAQRGAAAATIGRPFLALALDAVTRDRRRVLANGNLNNWVHRLWDLSEVDGYLGGSGGAGLGYGLGASIGAALAHRDSGRLVVDIQSDGDALMTPSALWTAAHHRVPLLIVLDNNRAYQNSVGHAASIATARGRGSVGRQRIGTTITAPDVDFAGLARSYGVAAFGPVSDPAELPAVLAAATDTVCRERVPVLVDVLTDEKEG